MTSLQPPAGSRPTTLPEVAAAALGFALIGGAGRGRAGALLRLAGVGLIGLAVRPVVVAEIRRAGDARRHIDAHASVEIERPIDEVFSFFKDFESFPRVAGGLRSVVDYQDGRSHWEAFAPSGRIVSWDVEVTKYVPRSVIAWESVPRGEIDMRGIVRFTALGAQRTRIDVGISSQPTQTRLDDALRSLLQRRQGRPLADVLDRLRFYLESQPEPSAGIGEPSRATEA